MGFARLFRDAGVTFNAAKRDAALAFCDEQEVKSLTEIVEYESVDDLMRALTLPIHSERKLRRTLEAHYVASAPWHVRLWRWAKGAAKEANEVPGLPALLAASRGGGARGGGTE